MDGTFDSFSPLPQIHTQTHEALASACHRHLTAYYRMLVRLEAISEVLVSIPDVYNSARDSSLLDSSLRGEFSSLRG